MLNTFWSVDDMSSDLIVIKRVELDQYNFVAVLWKQCISKTSTFHEQRITQLCDQAFFLGNSVGSEMVYVVSAVGESLIHFI